MISSINIGQQFMIYLFIKFSFIHLIKFCVNNAKVFQLVSMNINMAVGQTAADYSVVIPKARWVRPAFGESCREVVVRFHSVLYALIKA